MTTRDQELESLREEFENKEAGVGLMLSAGGAFPCDRRS